MTTNEFYVLKIVAGSISALFAITAAVFSFLESHKGDNQESLRTWFRNKWEKIQKNNFLKMPELIINWFLTTIQLFVKLPLRIIEIRWFSPVIVFFLVLTFISYGFYSKNLMRDLMVIFLFCVLPNLLWIYARIRHNKNEELEDALFNIMVGIWCSFGAIYWFSFTIKLSIQYAAVAMLIILPIYWLFIAAPIHAILDFIDTQDSDNFFSHISNIVDQYFTTFSTSVATSFSLTYVALLIGHCARPSSPLPQTIQMLISNIFFDGLTLVITLHILKWAISKKSFSRIPISVFVDIVAAAVLAIGSLYLGLIFTDETLTITETIKVLVARSPHSNQIDLSPYFWVMHTTFIPTCIYLLIILIAWTGKAILYPISWFFGAGHTNKNPLKLTAALFTLFAVTFAGIGYGCGAIEDNLKSKETPHKTTTVEDIQEQPLLNSE